MVKLKKSLFIFLVTLFGVLVSLGTTSDINAQEKKNKDNLVKSQGVNDSKNNNNLAVTNILSQKNSITKGNLESLSSTLAGFTASTTETEASMDRDEVMYKVIEYLNTPYLWGGTSKRGIDCSAFVQTVFYQSLNISLPRTSLEQSEVGEDVSRDNLKFGDLLFFDTMKKGRVTHVGMYLSDGYFVHSGSSTGVAVASLDSDFYSRVFLKAKRVID